MHLPSMRYIIALWTAGRYRKGCHDGHGNRASFRVAFGGLEPCAVKVARTVLREPGVGNSLGLLDCGSEYR